MASGMDGKFMYYTIIIYGHDALEETYLQETLLSAVGGPN